MKGLIAQIAKKNHKNGIDINPPASLAEIITFEEKIGFKLPTEFKEFYVLCNGFGCNEDVFTMLSLSEIEDYTEHSFYFSEYMIFSDMWGLRFTPSGKYEIFNGSFPEKTMTTSLVEFLQKFLKGNVFDKGGLYEWQEELGIQ